MPTCIVAGCGGYSLSGDICALCANTQPIKKLMFAKSMKQKRDEAALLSQTQGMETEAYISLVHPGSSSTPNATFASACQKYGDRFFALLAKGKPNGRPENIHGCMVHHDTQPKANRTVFFSWQGHELKIFGVGSHSGGDGAGNDSYTFTWFDGKSKNYTRK